MAYLYELLQYFEVAEDHVGAGAGAADGEEQIVARGAEVKPTFFSGGVQLGVFAGDLMRGDREARRHAQVADDVEVGAGGLHHQEVGAFFRIEERLTGGLAAVGRIHLVAGL